MDEIGSNPKMIKKKILKGIRTALLRQGSATKVELSEVLGISFPTISKFLAEMEKEGEILAAGLDDSSGGRRAKRYRYNPEHRLGLAIFLEKSETKYTVFNCDGEVKDQGKAPSVLTDDGLAHLTACLEGIMEAFPRIRSMAIGVPGSVNGGRIFYIPGYEEFENYDLKGYYERRFSIPVVIENDMNAAVLGYSASRSLKGQSLVYLYAGQNGPGAGVMLNGEVVRGSTFFSGEVSFVPQFDHMNFGQAISGEKGIDAVCRLAAAYTAILNPHTFIFCKGEVNAIHDIVSGSSKYVPAEHLPEFTVSDWEQDYLYGLQTLCLDALV
ncbi:ROK family protein [Metabacillus mangrovi]